MPYTLTKEEKFWISQPDELTIPLKEELEKSMLVLAMKNC